MINMSISTIIDSIHTDVKGFVDCANEIPNLVQKLKDSNSALTRNTSSDTFTRIQLQSNYDVASKELYQSEQRLEELKKKITLDNKQFDDTIENFKQKSMIIKNSLILTSIFALLFYSSLFRYIDILPILHGLIGQNQCIIEH